MSEPNWQVDGDPTHRPFWEGAANGILLVQRCADCSAYQFYGRPYCIRCHSDSVSWIAASGFGTVYSVTTVRRQWIAEFVPPYLVAIVELDEGPRMLTNIVNGEAGIGEKVRVAWRKRPGLPPVPVFEPVSHPGRIE